MGHNNIAHYLQFEKIIRPIAPLLEFCSLLEISFKITIYANFKCCMLKHFPLKPEFLKAHTIWTRMGGARALIFVLYAHHEYKTPDYEWFSPPGCSKSNKIEISTSWPYNVTVQGVSRYIWEESLSICDVGPHKFVLP
jgi:hypothetical protein